MTVYRYLSPIALLCIFLTGCATVPLEKTQTEKLKIDVSLLQEDTQGNVDVSVKYGFWKQPVTLADKDAFVVTENGQTIFLVTANQDGKYGYRGPLAENITQLHINSIGTVNFPKMTPISPTGLESFAEQRFSEDDQITLTLAATQANERVLVAAATCKKTPYIIEQELPTDAAEIKVVLHDILLKLNRLAEANLIGTIPITLRIEERYHSQLPTPFVAKKIAATEEVNFIVDTKDFRFKASFGIGISDNIFLTLANDEYKDKLCR